jgi:hypothetical protein
MSEGEEVGDKELLYTAVASALTLEFEKLSQIDLQQMAGLDEGNISRQIRNIHERVNRTYSIVKFNPIEVKGKKLSLIDEAKLSEFNDLVEDFFILDDMLRQIFDTKYGSVAPQVAQDYYKIFVPKYEKQVDELIRKETRDSKTWKEIDYSHIYLRKFLLKRIMQLGYELQGQVAISLVQTLPRDEIERLTRSLSTRKPEWEG